MLEINSTIALKTNPKQKKVILIIYYQSVNVNINLNFLATPSYMKGRDFMLPNFGVLEF